MLTHKHSRGWWLLVVLLALWLPSSVVLGQAPAPGPAVLYQFRTAGVTQPARFQLVHARLHFAPGAATPVHQHPGQVVVTVLEGENTYMVNDAVRVYRAGESLVELVGEHNQARNVGTTPLSLMATYLLPWDAPLSHPEPGDTTPLPRPTVSYQFKTDIAPMPEPFDVVQQGLEFAPGATTPRHTHPGIVMVTVLAGELTFNLNGVDTLYREGESFVEVPTQVVQARNASAAPTRVMVSYLLPAGAPLSAPHADPAAVQPGAGMPASLPNTGATPGALPLWQLLVGATALLVSGGWVLRRGRARR